MAEEDTFVGIAMKAVGEILGGNLTIRRGSALLYNVSVDNNLELTVKPKGPKRGQSAFQTDLCVFERKGDDVEIPRVVIEFKKRITTHDVLTYSTKAGKHKQVYPYLRYGIMIANVNEIPRRVFTHNDFLDFVVCSGGAEKHRLRQLFENLLKKEIEASRTLEEISFGNAGAYIFRRGIEVEKGTGRLS